MDKNLQRKRSSLKQKHLFPENMNYEEYIAQQKQKKIHFDSLIKEDENNNSDSKLKFKDAIEYFKDIVIIYYKFKDPGDDLYLHKLHEINQIKPTVNLNFN